MEFLYGRSYVKILVAIESSVKPTGQYKVFSLTGQQNSSRFDWADNRLFKAA